MGLEKYGKSEDFYKRQLKGLGTISYMQGKTEDLKTGKEVGQIPGFKEIVTWLAENMPKDENGVGKESCATCLNSLTSFM